MAEETKLLRAKFRLALKALRIADSVMEYCGGDKWERECTKDERAKFYKIYEKLVGRPGQL
jgi:hypothetical protein